MAVRVTDTSAALWEITDDEAGHSGQANPSTLDYGTNPDGSKNRDLIVVPCPVAGCGSVSWWPRESLPPIAQEKLP